MKRMDFLKLSVVCLAVLLNSRSVYGIHCWECADEAGVPKAQTCAYIMSEGRPMKCRDPVPYCLRITGEANGQKIAARSCGEANWKLLMGGTDKCTEPANVPNFKFSLANKQVQLKDGLVCICDTDNCNPAAIPRPAVAIIALGVFGLFFKHLCS